MIHVYGTSEEEIQELLRELKFWFLKNQPLAWIPHFDEKECKQLEEHRLCCRLYARMEDVLKPLGWIEKVIVEYIQKNKITLVPIYRGGDIIIRGHKDEQEKFSWEPLKVIREENPVDAVNKTNAAFLRMIEPGVEISVEKKLFGLAFEFEKVAGDRPPVKKISLDLSNEPLPFEDI